MDWNDPKLREKPKKEKPKAEEKEKEPMRCYVCGLLIYIKAENHCKCTIWDYAKKRSDHTPSGT